MPERSLIKRAADDLMVSFRIHLPGRCSYLPHSELRFQACSTSPLQNFPDGLGRIRRSATRNRLTSSAAAKPMPGGYAIVPNRDFSQIESPSFTAKSPESRPREASPGQYTGFARTQSSSSAHSAGFQEHRHSGANIRLTFSLGVTGVLSPGRGGIGVPFRICLPL